MAPRQQLTPAQQLLRLLDNPNDRRKARRLINLIRAEALRHGRRLMGEAVGFAECNAKLDEVSVVHDSDIDGG